MSKLPNDCIYLIRFELITYLNLSYTTTSFLLRQQKNNQNQSNTTGAQNLKEFNNTAGWLSLFFGDLSFLFSSRLRRGMGGLRVTLLD
jgi:hypothetical protein